CQAVYDALMDGQARARYTTPHACGHGVLHRPENQNPLVENAPPTLYRRQELPRYRNPEWHANVFAAAFLMPTAAVRALVDRYGADPYAMAETFGVSPRAADLRLHYMGLEVMTM